MYIHIYYIIYIYINWKSPTHHGPCCRQPRCGAMLVSPPVLTHWPLRMAAFLMPPCRQSPSPTHTFMGPSVGGLTALRPATTQFMLKIVARPVRIKANVSGK